MRVPGPDHSKPTPHSHEKGSTSNLRNLSEKVVDTLGKDAEGIQGRYPRKDLLSVNGELAKASPGKPLKKRKLNPEGKDPTVQHFSQEFFLRSGTAS